MTFWQLIGLAFVQGLTEFLPVSSSGHLILFSKFAGFADQGIALDIALHIGSLLAVVIYFRKSVWQMIKGIIQTKLLPDFANKGAKLAYLIIIASLPALCIGFFLRNFGMEALRSPRLIGWTILIYGLLLYAADKYGRVGRTIDDMGVKDALFVGFAQCLALIPGTSRSGITITMARFLGISRTEAAKFSLLLSVPTILAAGALEGYRMYLRGNPREIWWAMDAAGYSFVFSLLVIFAMMKWLQKSTYFPFVIYRVLLGGALILYSYNIF